MLSRRFFSRPQVLPLSKTPSMMSLRCFSTSADWPSFLTQEKGAAVDIILADSNDIMFNLATEEYIFEHVEVSNPILFLWRNSPTIIIGKH